MNLKSKPFTNEQFKDIYSRIPRLCVEVVIKTDQGVLLSLRHEHSYIGQWHIPGGTVYYKETLIDSVKRVALEELGIEVSVGKMLGYIEYFSEEDNRGYGYSIGIAFLCQPKSESFTLNSQSTDIKFFKEIPENTVLEQKEFLKERYRP